MMLCAEPSKKWRIEPGLSLDRSPKSIVGTGRPDSGKKGKYYVVEDFKQSGSERLATESNARHFFERFQFEPSA